MVGGGVWYVVVCHGMIWCGMTIMVGLKWLYDVVTFGSGSLISFNFFLGL